MATTKSRTGTVDPKTGVTVNVTDPYMTEQEKQRAAAEKAKASTANASGDSLLGDATPDPGNVDMWGNPIPTTDTSPPPPTGGTPGVGDSTLQVGASPGIIDPEAPGYVPAADTTPMGTAPQRTVTKDELVSTQMDKLLDENSKYMQQAKKFGLEYGGGLGGSSGVQAAYGAAIARGLPIAVGDAQAYRDAAAQNQNSLMQFGLANIQRATQLELGVMSANTQLQTTYMNNLTQTAVARMQDITTRDVANLDAATKIAVTELNGKIQASLAEAQFKYSQFLNDQVAANTLENTALQGEYNLEQASMSLAASDQMAYTEMYMTSYQGTLDRIAALNGMDIDKDAYDRSITAIWDGFYGQAALLAALYPNATPIQFEGQG